MKKIQLTPKAQARLWFFLWLITASMLVTVLWSFKDSSKDYEAACLQADFIRYTIDFFDGETECANIGSEIEECYYEWFQELDNGAFNTKHIKNIKDFNDYYWCY